MDAAASVPSWVTLLIQVPLVGVFIYYSMMTQNKFLEALDKRDEAFQRRNQALIDSMGAMQQAIVAEIKSLNASQERHDEFVREKVARARVKDGAS